MIPVRPAPILCLDAVPEAKSSFIVCNDGLERRAYLKEEIDHSKEYSLSINLSTEAKSSKVDVDLLIKSWDSCTPVFVFIPVMRMKLGNLAASDCFCFHRSDITFLKCL